MIIRIPSVEFRHEIRIVAYMKTKTNKKVMKMNSRIKTKEQTAIMAATIIAALSAAMIIGINGQNLQNANAQTYQPGIMSTASSVTNATAFKTVNPSQSTDKEFWINTVHLDGMTNLHAGVKCDTCPQNTPLHPPEQPPVNSTIPQGGGFRITEPNKVGAWDFRSFTFGPDQIVVNQGDKVALHFIGVQGAHHVISVEGVDTFELVRGQIHTVSFVANNPGTITYICHVHLPNMVGQILVLPKAAA
jgi:plastocyanin